MIIIPEQDEKKTITHKLETSFYELLLDQLGMLKLDDRNVKLPNRL